MGKFSWQKCFFQASKQTGEEKCCKCIIMISFILLLLLLIFFPSACGDAFGDIFLAQMKFEVSSSQKEKKTTTLYAIYYLFVTKVLNPIVNILTTDFQVEMESKQIHGSIQTLCYFNIFHIYVIRCEYKSLARNSHAHSNNHIAGHLTQLHHRSYSRPFNHSSLHSYEI